MAQRLCDTHTSPAATACVACLAGWREGLRRRAGTWWLTACCSPGVDRRATVDWAEISCQLSFRRDHVGDSSDLDDMPQPVSSPPAQRRGLESSKASLAVALGCALTGTSRRSGFLSSCGDDVPDLERRGFWIPTGHTDMRRRMQSLALTVQESLKRDPDVGVV